MLFENVDDFVADFVATNVRRGPDGGAQGGKVMATGTPEQVAKVQKSYTGQAIAEVLSRPRSMEMRLTSESETNANETPFPTN